jgi:hypothetical protein
MDTTKTRDNNKLFAELLSLMDEEKLIRLQKRAERQGFEDLAKFLKERRKHLKTEGK